jgi:hypothetical protein
VWEFSIAIRLKKVKINQYCHTSKLLLLSDWHFKEIIELIQPRLRKHGIFFVLLFSSGDTQGLMLARQALYLLTHTISPFLL